MYAVGRLGSYISRGVYTVSGPFHPFGGAVDIVVVEQPDGSFKSSPWYVRFGKFQGVLKTREKVVNISVNGVEADLHMYLDHKGEAYFLRELDMEEGDSSLYPLSSGDETDEPLVSDRRPMKSKSCKYDAEKRKSTDQFDTGSGKIVARTTSRRSRIFGLVFGRRSLKEDSYREGEGSPRVERVNSLERAEIAADLLEMKWSTNLVSRNYRKEKTSRLPASDALDGTNDRDMRVEDQQENVIDSSLQNEIDSFHNHRYTNSSASVMDSHDCYAEDASIGVSCVSSPGQVVESSRLGKTVLEEKHCVLSDVPGNSDHDETPNGDIAEMAFDPDRRIVYEEQDAVFSGSGTPNEDSVSNTVPSFVYYEASQNSVMRLDGSTEKTCEAQCISGGENGEASIHAETLLTVMDLSSEAAVVKQSEEMELDIEEAMVRDDHLLGSLQEFESHSLSATSSVGDSDNDVKTHKIMEGIPYPAVEQVGVDRTNTISSPPSESSEEEQFLFSDLDEFKLSRSDHVNNDHHASRDKRIKEVYQVTGVNSCSHSSMNQLAQDNQSADIKISNERSRIAPSPIRTLSGHGESSEKALQKLESLPNIWSPHAKLDAYNHHPQSHSLDSSSESMKMEFFCKDGSAFQEAHLVDIKSLNRSLRVGSSPISIISSYKVASEKAEREVEPFASMLSPPHGKLDAYDHSQSQYMDSNLGSLKMEMFSKDGSILLDDQSADKPDVKRSTKETRMKSSPISIHGNCGVAHQKAEQQVQSLPNIRSPNAKLQTHDSPSNSLGSNSKIINIQSFCTVDSIVNNDQLAGIKFSIEKSRMRSCPIGILSSPLVVSDVTGWQVKSLPDMWSADAQLDTYDHHPLGHSPDSTSESMKTESFFKDNSIVQDDPSADTESSSKMSKATSVPSNIVSSHRVTIEKPEQQVESLPNMWSQSDAHEHHHLVHSPDSNSESMKTELFSKDNLIVQDDPSADTKGSGQKLRMTSSPISILSSCREASKKPGRLVQSLPNMWSSDAKLDAHDHHPPISHSLGSKSESMKVASFFEFDLSCQKPNAEGKCQIAEERPNVEGSWTSWKLRDVHTNPAVELSLCKHLLYEGMGADAAARAFDAEKLDMSKFKSIGPTVVKNDRLVVRIGGRYLPWRAAAPILLGMVTFGSEEIFEPKGMIPVDRYEGDQSKESGSWRLWPFSFKRSRSQMNVLPDLTNARTNVENPVEDTVFNEDVEKTLIKPKQVKKMIRATTPTSEQLASLKLKEGRNVITFTFSTAMLGNQKVDARIYLWKWNTRIVISDVDGTITKSDVLGQFMPLVGIDWSQTGVAHLFSGIKENGYHLLFLSARAISQAYHTRQFLVNLKQDGKGLPDGPIVISPDGLFPSLYREVIRRAPHEFKIACLEDIRALFPPDYNPFYAGFGNRDTDEISYLKVGIPKGKIFIINPKGEVAVNRHINTKSYTSLHTLVNDMFPPMVSSEQEDFNSWNYWKLPPPVLDI